MLLFKLKQHRVDYTNRWNTIEDLCHWITQRTGQAAPRQNNGNRFQKKKYVNILKKLDREYTFRFLDLPAEMRNIIYELVLVYNEDSTAYPQILRTSKQVYEEAIGILRAESTITMRASADAYSGFMVQNRQITNDIYTSHALRIEGDLNYWFRSPSQHQQLLAKLAPFQRLERIHLSLRLTQAYDPRIPIHRASPVRWRNIISLISGLVGTCKSLRYLRIEWAQPPTRYMVRVTQEKICELLEPLKDLPEESRLDIRGLEDDTFQQVWREINEDREGNE